MITDQLQIFDPGPAILQISPLQITVFWGKVNVSIVGDYDFEEKDLWPDGDALDNWTAQDAQEVIMDYANDLGIYDDLDITIYVEDSPDGKKWA
jgi:hypothetical protein